MGYLAIARTLAGWQPQPQVDAPGGFYHFGYSLLLAPCYLALGSGWRVFRAATVLDSLLASLQVLVLYRFSRHLLRLERAAAGLVAVVAATYPAWLLQSSFVWSESLFALLFSCWAWCVVRCCDGRRGSDLAALALCAVGLYAVHPRGLGVALLTSAAIAWWGIRGRLPRATAFATVGVALLACVLTRALAQELIGRLWLEAPRARELGVLDSVTRPDLVTLLAQRAAGQAWYLLVATLGVWGVGVWALSGIASRRGGRRMTPEVLSAPRDSAPAAGLVLVAAATVFATSVIFMVPAVRSDHLLYGRYNEATMGPILVAGLAWLGDRRRSLVPLAASHAALLALGLLLWRWLPAAVSATQPVPTTVLAVLVWNRWPSLDVARTTWLAAAACAVLALVAWRRRRLAAVLLGSFFVLSTVVLERRLYPWCAAVQAQAKLHETLGSLRPRTVAYDRRALSGFGFNAYQFRLDRVRFRLFDGGQPSRPAEPLVISSADWEGKKRGYRIVDAEPRAIQTLWVAPGALQASLGRRGWLWPTDPAAPLPAGAARSRLTLERREKTPLRLQAGVTSTIAVRLEHLGAGFPWVPFGPAREPRGAVRLGARWRGRDGAWLPTPSTRADLPRSLRPGERVVLRLPVETKTVEGEPLPPGAYELQIEPIQELVRWFSDAGDQPLRIPVEIRG